MRCLGRLGESDCSLWKIARLTLSAISGHWIDVRDVALAHVLALQKEELSGERIIVASPEPYKMIEWRTCFTLHQK